MPSLGINRCRLSAHHKHLITSDMALGRMGVSMPAIRKDEFVD